MEIELEARQRVNFVSDGIQLTPRDTGALLQALAESRPLGIDVYARGGTIDELEQRFAVELGKEQAVYLPTGTLANHLALRAQCGAGGRAFVQAESHVFRDSGNAIGVLSQITAVPLGLGRHDFTAEEFEQALARNAEEKVASPARVLSIESPVRRYDGRCFAPDELSKVLAIARDAGLALHRDGARIHFDAAWNGTPVRELAAPYDTVYCSLHKAFNAPAGAILAGPARVIEGLHHTRRMFGASPAHAWPQAAIALHFLDGFGERMARAVACSREFFAALDEMEGCRIEHLPNGTHVTRLHMTADHAKVLCERAPALGIDLPEPHPDGRLDLRINESILHQSLGRLIAAFGPR